MIALFALQGWLGQQQQQMRASSNIARALMPRTASLEQAGGLHRMVLRGHSGPVQKVLLTPGGTDVVTGIQISVHSTLHGSFAFIFDFVRKVKQVVRLATFVYDCLHLRSYAPDCRQGQVFSDLALQTRLHRNTQLAGVQHIAAQQVPLLCHTPEGTGQNIA